MSANLSRAHPVVMGIVNVTPDSFSDGGQFSTPEAGVAHGLSLIEEGADWLDIGGESTRPGADPVSVRDEMARVVPVIEALTRLRPDIPLSIDTMKPEVAEAAIASGARLWNDVNGLRAPGAPRMAAKLGCGVCLMHMLGEPKTMQSAPVYTDVVREVSGFLTERIRIAVEAGVKPCDIWLDPGIGFGKTLAHNLKLLRHIEALKWLGFPILIGASRKRFIGELDAGAEADHRLGGSLAVALYAARQGAAVVRVHDVRATVQALKVQSALLFGE
ncbi:dihydropteroate synthase [Woodsholea maritima]|uniref:dihydropteroate synthase n=1 Tax=Woodsholea maritima TaxID=240237 RepID=UPI00036BC53F|nr:dihydropteroate synthase [Woodsholea maritima]